MSRKKGVIDMIVGKIGGVNDDDDFGFEDDDYYDDEPGGNIEPFRRGGGSSRGRDLDDYDEPERPAKKPSRPVLSSKPRKSSGSGNEVCVIKPTSIEEAREVTDTLLADRVVVLNLEGLDVDNAQRIIDFTSGSTYAINGNLQKISRYIFIITPASVDISGDFQDLLTGSLSQSGPQRMD
jgi:cell division inhibitor SepF